MQQHQQIGVLDVPMYHAEKVIAALNCSYVKFTICITNYHTQGLRIIDLINSYTFPSHLHIHLTFVDT